MSCRTCGSNTRCGCSGTIVGVVLNRPNACDTACAPDCCENTVHANPTPFYNCAPACAEGHTKSIFIQQFVADIKIQDSWNVPGCGLTATVTSIELQGIVVGSYIWNPTYGYFEITAFNPTTNQITILNHCNEGNAAAGTTVPSCTEFTVTVPPCDCGSDSDVCVAIDFTAPDVDDCVDITLSGTTGLTAGDTIQIGTGFYFLEEIKPNDVVTICNQGEGITPGTSVIALDANGNYQYCISIISTNPCDRDAVLQGAVIVCNEDGVTSPLTATADDVGSFLTITNPNVNNFASFRPNCTNQMGDGALTLQFFALPLVLGDYTALAYETVVDTSIFTIGPQATCTDQNNYVKAVVGVNVLPNHDVGVVMHEVELRWSNNGPPHQASKLIWTDFGSDGYDLSGVYPPTTDFGVWGNAQMQAGAPLYSMQYHGGDINAISPTNDGTLADLSLRYKSLIGDNMPPSLIDGLQFEVSGVVEILRANN